ncbi:MAG TPA: type I-U CRISPR-associated protein Csb2 [Fibrobacteria bacterium]|nr:type I-U CRISPR-associated protein Csb2 [Fibrobacteria bacterium]HOX50223.1 type I-U CRISPR-associated protein Csb2 [Fibrobacteria bacterium]
MSSSICLVVVAGGLPPPSQVVLVTQRLRGAVIRQAMRGMLPESAEMRWESLGDSMRQELSGLTGKNADGSLLQGGLHMALFPWYGSEGEPDRLYAWKREGFSAMESTALLQAVARPIRWGEGDRLVRLAPFGRLPLPESWTAPSREWHSLTPFVPVGSRFRFRTDGSPKKSETPQKQIRLIAGKQGLPVPEVDVEDAGPVRIHHTLALRRQSERSPATHWPGVMARLSFPEPVAGPLFFGHSAHFGLGLFEAVSGA